MSVKKSLLLAVLCIFLAFAGIFFYYYTHPRAVASLVERGVSRFAGISVDIRDLSYTFRPLQIEAKEITVTPASDASGFSLKIPKLNAHMFLDGPFGERSLVLDTIRIGSFSLDYSQADFKPIPKKKPSVSVVKPVIIRLIAYLFFKDIRINEVILTEGNLAAHLNGSELVVKDINARRGPDKRIEVAADTLYQRASPETSIRIPDLRLSLEDVLSLSDPIVRGRISAKQMRLTHPEIKIPALGFRLEGDLDVSKQQINAPVFAVSADDHLQMTGALTVRAGAEPDVVLSVRDAFFFPEKILSLLPERFKGDLPPLSLTGKVSAGGTFKIMKKQTGWDWSGDIALGFSENVFSYLTQKHRLHGRITGTLGVGASHSDVSLTGNLSLKQTRFSDPNISLDLSSADISLKGKHPTYKIENTSAKIAEIKGIQSGKGIPLEDISLHIAEGVFDLEQASYRFSEIRLQSPLLRNLTANVTGDQERIRFQIKGDKTGLPEAVRTLNLLPSGWQYGAEDAISIDAVFKPPARLSFDTRIHLEKMGFQDPQALIMGENIGLNARVEGELNLSDASVAGSVVLNMKGGEILYDLYYVDLKSNPFSFSGESVLRPSAKSVEFKNLTIALENALSMKATGVLKVQTPLKVQLSLEIPPAPLGPLFKLFVVDPLQSKKPFLSDFKIGGRVSTHLKMDNTGGGWSVKGRLRWQDGSLSMQDKNLGLGDIRMDVPIWYLAGNENSNETPLEGDMTIGRLTIPPMPEQPVSIRIRAAPNSLMIPGSLEIRIPGGSARLGPVTIHDVFSRNISAKTDVAVNPTDIAPLLSSVWPDMPKSQLYGTLDPVIIRGDRIETAGVLTWEGFGGKIILSKLGIDRFLTAGSLIRLTAKLDDLNLGQVTGGTAFGRIDGVLKGSIRDLEIIYGQPQGFDLLLETEKKRGISQKISIKAVNNIAQIGGGQSPFVGLAGTFTTLFETLNYEKIGIRASLINDMFKINGTVVDQGREYLMKGSLLAGVNIINQNPDNRIRFKDMVKRIKRVTSGDGKPVIQ